MGMLGFMLNAGYKPRKKSGYKPRKKSGYKRR